MVVILQEAKDESEEREQFEQTGGPDGRGRREGRRHGCAVQADLNTLKYRSNSGGVRERQKVGSKTDGTACC